MDQGVYDLSRNSEFAAFAFIGYKERAAAIDYIAFVLPPEIIPVALVFPEFDYLDALVRRYDSAEAVPELARTPSQGQIEQQRELCAPTAAAWRTISRSLRGSVWRTLRSAWSTVSKKSAAPSSRRCAAGAQRWTTSLTTRTATSYETVYLSRY